MTKSSGIFVIYLDIRLYSVICNFRKLVYNLHFKGGKFGVPSFFLSFSFFLKTSAKNLFKCIWMYACKVEKLTWHFRK
jgi:hypothetical protein